MRKHVFNRYRVLVFGLILLFASAVPSLGNSGVNRSKEDATFRSLSERFTMATTFTAEPYPPLVRYSMSAVAPTAFSSPVRLDTGLLAARGPTEETTGPRKRNKLSGELGIGYAIFTTKGIGGGLRYGMSFMGMVSPRVGLEVVLERLKAPVDGDVDPLGLGKGTLYVTPLTANMQYRWPEMGRFTLYALLGVGFHFAHFLPEEGEEEVADRLALIFGGGVDTRLGRNTALHMGLKFTPVPTWVQEKGSHADPDEQEKIWLNMFTFTLGIKYFFN